MACNTYTCCMSLPNDLIRLLGISLNAKSMLAISSCYRAMRGDRYQTVQMQRLTINSKTPDGRWNGVVFDYFSNGYVYEQCMMKNGELHGCCENWHFSRNQSARSYYKNGKKNGVETRWRDDGYYTSRCSYKNDKKHGYMVIIDIGNLTVEKYVDGRQVSINMNEMHHLFTSGTTNI